MQLVLACRAGDRIAVETFVRSYKAPLYRLALSLLDDPQEADEATQEALLVALEKLDSFRGQAQLKTWLYTITLNVCRGLLRKRGMRERLAQAWNALGLARNPRERDPDDIASANEVRARLWQAVWSLPNNEREVIVLRYYHEFEFVEIARIVGVSDRTIRTRNQNALGKLRAQLEGKFTEP